GDLVVRQSQRDKPQDIAFPPRQAFQPLVHGCRTASKLVREEAESVGPRAVIRVRTVVPGYYGGR
ncbi:hypothetical protein, partial [Streptomyces hirsutus]|uniref:hypothetical protein n=1 Tax=Streptomyces hirsutus TaxID=35620 RepID=UPI0036CBE8FA